MSVAARIVRRKRSMPLMVRAQALALVAIVAGSIVGGGALAGVVAYRAVAPIVHAIAEPVGDRAPTRHDELVSAPPTAPSEATPDAPAAIAPRAESTDEGPDRPLAGTATKVGIGTGGDAEERDDPADGGDEADGDDRADGDGPDGGGGPAAAGAAESTESAEEPDPDDVAAGPEDEPAQGSEAAGTEQSSGGEGLDGSDHGDGPDGG